MQMTLKQRTAKQFAHGRKKTRFCIREQKGNRSESRKSNLKNNLRMYKKKEFTHSREEKRQKRERNKTKSACRCGGVSFVVTRRLAEMAASPFAIGRCNRRPVLL
jgi:hypothetical protein